MKYIISAACLLLAIVTAVTAEPAPPPYAPDAGVARTVCDTPAEPITQLPANPTPPVVQASKTNDATTYTNRPFDPAEWDYVTVTAYCACADCCGAWAAERPMDADGAPIVYGAAGVELVEGKSVAVMDTDRYPMGTVLEVWGVGTRVVHDCGSSYGDVDVYFADHDAAVAFGIQTAWIRAAAEQ